MLKERVPSFLFGILSRLQRLNGYQFWPIMGPPVAAGLSSVFIVLIHPIQWAIATPGRLAGQTKEKAVLRCHQPGQSSTVHSPDGASYFLPV